MNALVCPTARMEKLMVATDGSEYSESALREAINLAKICSSSVIAVSVVKTNLEFDSVLPEFVENNEQETIKYLELVKAQATTDSAAGDATLWLQVSSSQNPEWAHELAEQLADAGFETVVWEPEEGEEGYRVMVGPFLTREAADEAGRRLGRPYFVVARASDRPPG